MDILKKKEFLIVMAGFVCVIGLSWWGIIDSKNQEIANIEGPVDAKVRIYYGKECPHCEKLFEYISENKIAEKVIFSKQEVWHNKANQKDMLEKTKECGLPEKEVGVPLLYSEGKCYIGEEETEKFFTEMLQ